MGDIFDKVKAADDIVSETVHVDEWDVDIDVRTMDGNALEKMDFDAKTFRADMIIATCYEPGTDTPVFPGTDEVKEMLMGKAAASTSKIVRVAMRLNGFSDEGRQELKNG